MPKRPERMALYIRESDPRLANSVTIESQAKLAREYGENEGYIYNSDLEFREAISAYDVPYTERVELLKMLDAARKKLFDVLVVAEVRAIGRRQVEILVIYDMLLKYGVRLETVKEKFGEDAMSKEILASRSLFAEIEVEQSKMRMMRGRTDRVAIGQAPNGGTCVYTHRLVDTETEISGRYELNDEVVYTDAGGKQWTRVDVALFFCSLLVQGGSLAKAAQTLNSMGVPSAKGKHWTPETIRRIVSNPILYGQPYANRAISSSPWGAPKTAGKSAGRPCARLRNGFLCQRVPLSSAKLRLRKSKYRYSATGQRVCAITNIRIRWDCCGQATSFAAFAGARCTFPTRPNPQSATGRPRLTICAAAAPAARRGLSITTARRSICTTSSGR
jgi:DNA invertase Pin-like site-specific DNA recombinase